MAISAHLTSNWQMSGYEQMERVVAATLLALGSRELSGQIHMNSAGRHENLARGYIIMERSLFYLLTV